MIAVLADDAERSLVCEFFELFKTPWEFYRSGSQYDVVICSNAQFRISSAKLVLAYGVDQKSFDQENGIETIESGLARYSTYDVLVLIHLKNAGISMQGKSAPNLTNL